MQEFFPNSHDLELVHARSWFRKSHARTLCSLPLDSYCCGFLTLKLLTQELAEEGYAGVEVRVTPLRTEIIISATRPQNVLGEKGQRIRELTSVVQKRCVNPSLCATFARVLRHFSSAGRFPFYPGWLTPFFTTDFCASRCW